MSLATAQAGSKGDGWEYDYGRNNRIYNNTFFSNGWNWSSYGVVHEDDTQGSDYFRTGISFNANGGVVGNVIKNNLFYNNWTLNHHYSTSIYYPDINALYATNVSNNTISNNYTMDNTYLPSYSRFTNASDPLFVNPDISSPLGMAVYNNYSLLKPDLRLQASSPAKDKGTYLTTAIGNGTSSITLTVVDASFFQDGKWGSDLARATGSMKADTIAVGNAKNISQINSINYGSNIITLSSPLTWNSGDKVWLYKKSDGERVLYGAAPDMGAHEIFLGEPPLNFRIIAQ